MASTWTRGQLEALEAALAQGSLRVEYEGKAIWYRSLDEMLRLRALMQQSLGMTAPRGGRVLASFSKGLEK